MCKRVKIKWCHSVGIIILFDQLILFKKSRKSNTVISTKFITLFSAIFGAFLDQIVKKN